MYKIVLLYQFARIMSPSIKNILIMLQLIVFGSLILMLGKTLFIPLFFGLLIAIVMHPFAVWLESHGWNKALAIAASILIVALLFTGLVALLLWQIGMFREEAPSLLHKLEESVNQMQSQVNIYLGTDAESGTNWAQKATANIFDWIGASMKSTANTLFIIFMTPVYMALFMYHRGIMVKFLHMIVPEPYKQKLHVILGEIVSTYSKYIKGMVMVYLIVGTLNSLGLMALGVKHAILYGVLCAIMTIIPYVGIIVSALLPISMIWLDTGNIWYPLGVIAIFSFVQYLEANVIFPKVVGAQLHVSTLSMLVAAIIGGIIWGVAGMVLFIPFVAILKIISDHIDEWKPLNLLLSR